MVRYLYIIILSSFLSLPSIAQKPRLKEVLWSDNWKLEIKTGTVAILSPVPDKYLEFTNKLNVPIEVPGTLGILSAKKSLGSHVEVGYQFDYLRVQGEAQDVNHAPAEVRSQIFTHTFQGQYNFKRNNEFTPLVYYFVYYKAGGVSVRNDRIIPGEGVPGSEKSRMLTNVAVLSALGAGINYQLSHHFSLTAAVDINRSSDRPQEVIYIHKLFYNSTYTVNKYVEASVGLAYWFSFSAKKKSTYYRSRPETERLILQQRIEKKKGQSSDSNYPIWFDHKRGK